MLAGISHLRSEAVDLGPGRSYVLLRFRLQLVQYFFDTLVRGSGADVPYMALRMLFESAGKEQLLEHLPLAHD